MGSFTCIGCCCPIHVCDLWINREMFFLKDQLIWKKGEGADLLVVPQSLQREIIRLNHDLPSAGHAGKHRTSSKIKTKYYWYGMSKDIQNYIVRCATQVTEPE